MMGVLTQPVRKTSTCSTLLSRPLISTPSVSLDRLGLSVTGQQIHDDHSQCWPAACSSRMTGVIAAACKASPATASCASLRTCRSAGGRRSWRCGCAATAASAAGMCGDRTPAAAAAPRAKLSRHAVLWALKSVVIDRLSIARVAANLGVTWHTVNDAVLGAGRDLLINDPTRLNGVRVLGVDEHCWRHTRRGDKFVTVIIDLTPVRDRSRPGTAAGHGRRSFQGGVQDLARRPDDQRSATAIEVVAMDGFTGFKTAAAETVPDAVAVMDPFHVVALAGDALDRCRQRDAAADLRTPRPLG